MNGWAHQLDGWHDFYVLIGTAAATLMGLTFVAVSLAPGVIAGRVSVEVRAFLTPIVAFFATVLIVALVLSIPDLNATGTGVFFAAVGICGFTYVCTTGVHTQWRRSNLGIDDWIWYLGLPLVGYAANLACAFGMWMAWRLTAYVVAGAVLLLVIVGIRNAWDVVLTLARESQEQQPPK